MSPLRCAPPLESSTRRPSSRGESKKGVPMGTLFDPHFLWLTVHDLRNPLNVIKLTLRMVQDTLPRESEVIVDDLRMIHNHVIQLERMLSHLSDYGRLTATEAHVEAVPFDPRRFVGDVVEDFRAQPPIDPSP